MYENTYDIKSFFLEKEKKMIEKQNEKIINEIEAKRKEFYEEYEITPPSKEAALEKIKGLTQYVFFYFRI